MREIIVLALKDLHLLLRDRIGLFFTLFFPILTAAFFGMMFSGDSDSGERSGIPVLVVDEDGTDASKRFVAALEAETELDVSRHGSLAEAMLLVKKGKATACIAISAGFGENLEQPFWGEAAELRVGVDPSRGPAGAMLQGILMKHSFGQLQAIMSDSSAMQRSIDKSVEQLRSSTDASLEAIILVPFLESLGAFLSRSGELTADGAGEGGAFTQGNWQPVAIEKIPFEQTSGNRKPQVKNSFSVSFPQGILWGFLGCCAAFGISLVVERTRGTLIRLYMAPISRGQVLAGKGLACFVTTTSMATLLLLIGRFVFDVRPDSVPLLAMAVVACAICFVGIMMLLSVLGRTEAAAGGIGWSVLLVLSMFGGGMVPLFVLPGWVTSIANFSPVRWAIYSMEGAIWRDFTFLEMLRSTGVLVAIGVVSFAVGASIFRKIG